MPFQPETIFQISDNIVFRKQKNDSFVLIEVQGSKLFELNEVSAFVWNLLVEKTAYADIIEAVRKAYEDVNDQEASEVDEFLEQLMQAQIITPK